MIKIQASVSKGWLNEHGGYVFPDQYYFNPIFRWEQDNKINQFVSERFPKYAIYNMEDNLIQSYYVKANHVLVGVIQPNMILAALLGSKFSFSPDKDSDVLGRPLENISNAQDLPSLDSILDNPLIKDLERQIQDIRKVHPELRVIPPFFWDESGGAYKTNTPVDIELSKGGNTQFKTIIYRGTNKQLK
jgi:hypothetical protein